MNGKAERMTRKYRNSLLYRVLLNRLSRESDWQIPKHGCMDGRSKHRR